MISEGNTRKASGYVDPSMRLDCLPMSPRLRKLCGQCGLRTVAQARAVRASMLLRVPGFGRGSVNELRALTDDEHTFRVRVGRFKMRADRQWKAPEMYDWLDASWRVPREVTYLSVRRGAAS